MSLVRQSKASILQTLPLEGTGDLLPEIQSRVRASGRKVIVLDDDPTGTQTVHNVPVLTGWSIDALCTELENDLPAIFLLTNSRSVSLTEAQAINTEIGRNLTRAAKQTGRGFVVVSRSDSTLRGHFPGEVTALAEALNREDHNWLIIPSFFEGGRFTIGDIHYVEEGGELIPVGESAFAQDKVFGFRSSDLRGWVEEKTVGSIRSQDVASISLELIRSGGPDQVARRLMDLNPRQVCVINAASYRDMEIFVLGLLAAEEQGYHFLYRSAASFARVRAGIPPRLLLTTEELYASRPGGGLIVVGSYVSRTTSQLDALLESSGIQSVEVNVDALLDQEKRPTEINRAAEVVNNGLKLGRDVVVFTSRRLISGDNHQESLSIGQEVSSGLVAIVRNLEERPRYLLAKGGITSSDIATQALGIQRALVLGQILPGVPVWQPGEESRYPGMPYIVFPGNVGNAQSLVDCTNILSKRNH